MPERQTTVFYHGDCQDGFGAAWCAWRHFGAQADYQPMHYGDPWPAALVDGREVFILDFSAPIDTVRELASRARRLLMLDHHATPFNEWRPLLSGDADLQRYDDPDRPLTVAFDMKRSGARLAWDWFFPGAPLPRTIAHIEDQDLWRFALPETRAYCRALGCHAFEFAHWDRLVDASGTMDDPAQSAAHTRMLIEGAAIQAFHEREVGLLARGPAVRVRLRGRRIDPRTTGADPSTLLSDGKSVWQVAEGLCVNANAFFASDVGGALAERSGSFGMTWYLRGDGRIKASLRGNGTVDVAAIAENYGGGGHPNAAGFTLEAAVFFRSVLAITPP